MKTPEVLFHIRLRALQLSSLLILGVENGKIRDSPRRRDPCLKIRDRDFKALTKSEPKTPSRFPELLVARHDNELHDIQ